MGPIAFSHPSVDGLEFIRAFERYFEELSMRFSALAALVLSTAALTAGQINAQATTPWDYEGKRGALAWHRLDPAYKVCSAGHQQAPIDIRGAHLNKTLKPIEFHYIAGPVTLENDGHTIVVHVDHGSYMMAGGVRYDLVEYKFHHPSEETVKGKLSDMDIQLVHKSADGGMAVVAIRLVEDPGNPNAVLATLWPHLPKTAGTSEKVTDEVNAGGLLPADRGYWTYMGSLTTPPCTEGVRWFVFEQELSIDREQLRTFGALFKINTRPMQDAHGRRIEANE
jgi:carbonic anhydrase